MSNKSSPEKKQSSTGKKSNVGRKNHVISDTPKVDPLLAFAALSFIEDVFDRAMMPFVLLDEVAQQIKEGQEDLNISEVSIGVREQDMTEYGRSTLRAFLPGSDWNRTNVYTEHQGVPIIIWRIHNELEVFKFPDQVHFSVFTFHIPNPFKQYWKIRDLIK